MVVSGADGLDGSAGDLHIEDEAPALAARAADHYLVVHRLLFFAKQTGEMAVPTRLALAHVQARELRWGAYLLFLVFHARARRRRAAPARRILSRAVGGARRFFFLMNSPVAAALSGPGQLHQHGDRNNKVEIVA